MFNVRDKLKKLFQGRDKPLSTSVVTHSKVTEGAYGDFLEHSPGFQKVAEDAPVVPNDKGMDIPWEGTPDAVADLFYGLFDWNEPEIVNHDDIRTSRLPWAKVMESLINSDEFQKVRPFTRFDEFGSAVAAMDAWGALKESLQTELNEVIERSNEAQQSEDRIAQLVARAEELREKGKNGTLTDEEKQELRENARQRQELLNQMAQQREQMQQDLANLQGSIGQATDQALQDAGDSAQAMQNIPGMDSNGRQFVDPQEAIRLAEKWRRNETLKNIAKLVGRFERDMRFKRTNRIVGGREEIIDVRTGDEIPLILPSEKLRLMHPLLKLDFIRRYYERSLVQYETQGTTEAGSGPLVCVLDESGSMGSGQNEWGRAVCLALLEIAHREKRDVAFVTFSSYVTGDWFFPAKDAINLEDVTDFATHYDGGGTSILNGLTKAEEIILTVPEFKKADIVLLTDGEDYFEEGDMNCELRDRLRGKGVRIHGISIGFDSHRYLPSMCDTVASVYDLTAPSDATTKLAEAIT